MHSSSVLGLLTVLFAVLLQSAVGAPSEGIYPQVKRQTNLTYEYIVVGSGAGGGPLASRLARAGHSVLLIESGDDQGNGQNNNYSVPGYQAAVTQDPKMRWDMFVNHYQDQTRAQRDPKYTWDVGNGQYYVGQSPPAGATPLGIL